MADYEISQLVIKASPAASTDYLPLLDTTDHSTPPAGAGGSDKRATIAAVVQAALDLGLLVQVPSSYANGTFVGPGDGAQYSNFNLADGTYPLDQNPGGHYWAFSHRADAPAHRLLIYSYNGAGHYSNNVTITEGGAFSTLANTLDDGSGNATFAGTVNLAAGTVTLAPLKIASGTLLTTASAGAAEFDGTAFYATAAASSRQVVDAEQFTCLSSSYTLANSTSAQKIFNASANGALTVQGNTTYYFECEFDITGLSASAHTISFGFGGTATYTSVKYVADRLDSSTAFSTAQSWTKQIVTTAAATALTAAGVTTTGLAAMIRGYVRVNAGGTLIPQVTQGTASAAAVVSANSWARLIAVGSGSVASVGNWS